MPASLSAGCVLTEKLRTAAILSFVTAMDTMIYRRFVQKGITKQSKIVDILNCYENLERAEFVFLQMEK